MMELQLRIAGALLIVLALMHIFFPRYFRWTNELMPVSLITRQMFYVHTFFIALVVLLMGLLCLTSAAEMTTSVLGGRVALGLSIFWGLRLVVQFFGYSAALWKGKRLETIIHVVFSLLWVYLATVFFCGYR